MEVKESRFEDSFKDWAVARGVPIIRDSSHELLIELVQKYRPKHILEIGTAVGYSGITMLENSDADLLTVELMKESADEAVVNFKNAGYENRVRVVNNDCSLFIMDLMSDEYNYGKFDFIFLDGPKAQYINLYPSLITLLSPGGVLVADNVLFRGYVEHPETAPRRFKTIWQRLRKFIDTVQNSDDLENVRLYKIEDGVLVAEKKIKG